MSTFPLRVGTPDGLLYEGDVARVVCRTISGDLAILPGHCNYCTALGMGQRRDEPLHKREEMPPASAECFP